MANFNQIGEFFAEKNICIRCGGHCAYPLHKHYHLGGTCRMSAYLNNDISDLEKFFARLEELVKKLIQYLQLSEKNSELIQSFFVSIKKIQLPLS